MHISIAPMIGLLVFVAIVVAGAISAEATVTTLALWRLGEDDSGAVAGNTGNDTTTDAVGFFDLDRGGDPAYSSNTPGPGSALSMAFDGTGDVYSRGEPVTTATALFGIEAWVYLTTLDTGGEHRVIAYNGDLTANGWNDPNANGWGLTQRDASLFGVHGGVSLSGFVADTADRWYHVALVQFTGTGSRFYLNGVFSGITDFLPNAPTDPFQIGGNIAGMDYFEGNIDHVRVFSVEEDSFDPQTDLSLGIPEPSSIVLAALGVVGLVAFAWRRHKERVDRSQRRLVAGIEP